ncbi:SAC3_GANP domain-containing protein [Cephalotus follicularis]|uniref:SAC3_GANP domain-containing protein n=1 Tax=Cephalotus follicularis TaxID=3775 RepID=A0A1Q3B6D4_CEPFO|nr:SAC3_GANP domain-containing protein [Cephalotus follicularis]
MSFGKQSGPQPQQFNNLPRSHSFFPVSAPAPPLRGPGTVERMPSPPLPTFESYGSHVRPRQSAGVQRRHEASQRVQPPPLDFPRTSPAESPFYPSARAQRPALSSPAGNNIDPVNLPGSYPNFLARQDQSSVSPFAVPNDSGRSFMNKAANVQAPKWTRSPPILLGNEVYQQNPQFSQKEVKRPSISPPKLGTGSDSVSITHDSQIPRRSSLSVNDIVPDASRSTSSSVSKRLRPPSSVSAIEVFQGSFHSTQDDSEREMQAKAKRLVRFKTELSEVAQNPDVAVKKISANRREQSMVQRQKFVGELSMGPKGDLSNGNAYSDYEGLVSPSVIIGLCPDMCPESERAERERKGDLDQYERLDGDRNQTSKFLAVKKYNRSAEREACLIRPMSILQMTVDYLLSLLDQPYDDRFLGMYNFLWDRMRAIRMDLRMQHIFNRGSITMLEQMIRLHIIAMHELCEYNKGEGFSEGFDAHLNIEQMNKTSVELFQLYDDHRKKGINVSTEKEFRGYYALLKLDKHPGYNVEPAELSLELAKMTQDIRQTPEVRFARDVARACRTGNFIAFFRLARKASYLQACLMHAHFGKLRTQALASLHSGLQNNQGIPVAKVSRWLGMEEEDIEILSEYHGFLVKEFEEPYMVKDGPLLNIDKDYPTKCSKLIHLKKSRTILEDVLASCQEEPMPTEATKETQLGTIYRSETKAVSVGRESSSVVVDEEMSDFEVISSPKDSTKVQSITKTSIVDQRSKDVHSVAGASAPQLAFSFAHTSPTSPAANVGMLEKPNNFALSRIVPQRESFGMEDRPLQIVAGRQMQKKSPSGRYDHTAENSVPQSVVIANLEEAKPPNIRDENDNDEIMEHYHDEKVANAALKLIIRLWRRHSSKQRELREQRQLAAEAALNSLSLGPPIRQNKDKPSILDEFDIDHIMRMRFYRHQQSWLKLNVSDVIGDTLCRRNPDAKCLCWKIILCSLMDNLEGDKLIQRSQLPHLAAGKWLFSKLMPSGKDNDDDLVVSSPGLSIWKKWISSQSSTDLACCLSVVKHAEFDKLNETVSGASAVMFLVSESITWKLQKNKLHNLLMSIPSGSCLPLLILSGCSYNEEVSDRISIITKELGLNDIDKSRISCFLVVFLVGIQQNEQSDGFFSDERLREGLQWLASRSPLQPILHCVKTRDLVLPHLRVLLEVLEKRSVYEVCPNHCISAFNDALDQSVEEIAAAAKASPANWPCPEIGLLGNSSDEHLMVNWYLPSTGWSSAARIESLVCALRACRLPSFPEDTSWSKIGPKVGNEIENQKMQLENCLIRYLTQSSEMMGVPQATKEVCAMIQRGTRLELHDLSYYIVPNWVMIFRRIFNWRLMSLSSEAFSSAYILECHHLASTSGNLDKLWLEGSVSSYHCLNHPSLDEVIEVSRSPLVSVSKQPEVFQPSYVMVSDGEVPVTANPSDLVEDERNSTQNDKLAVTSDAAYGTSGLYKSTDTVVTGRVTTEAENSLSQLFEQCTIVQNKNDKALSIYFGHANR